MGESLFWLAVIISPIVFIAWIKNGANFSIKVAILFYIPIIFYAITKQDIAAIIIFVLILSFFAKNEI